MFVFFNKQCKGEWVAQEELELVADMMQTVPFCKTNLLELVSTIL